MDLHVSDICDCAGVSPFRDALIARLSLDLACAVACLKRGGILIYPTETFFALGCLANAERALSAIYQLKGRKVQQPLPLLAGSREQAGELVEIGSSAKAFLQKFWPGPLSLLAVPQRTLAQCLLNAEGKCALRVSSHGQARRLAQEAGWVLSASSANFSGQRPASRLEELDPLLLQKLYILQEESGLPTGLLVPSCAQDEPRGGLPSTIIEALSSSPQQGSPGATVWRILRQGAIGIEVLKAAGLEIGQ